MHPRNVQILGLLVKGNKKLSYRRDSARRQSLRRSRSIKVTDVNRPTNVKHVCDFLSANNTNLHAISHRFANIAQYWSNYRL